MLALHRHAPLLQCGLLAALLGGAIFTGALTFGVQSARANTASSASVKPFSAANSTCISNGLLAARV
ncbi:MAG: hypothetical protein OK455_06110, partial [Thaumarchaeota archaeon]|nr:hypothetical protein [Nitrososphaerota archaeon]